jgi:hypothetical protein
MALQVIVLFSFWQFLSTCDHMAYLPIQYFRIYYDVFEIKRGFLIVSYLYPSQIDTVNMIMSMIKRRKF